MKLFNLNEKPLEILKTFPRGFLIFKQSDKLKILF